MEIDERELYHPKNPYAEPSLACGISILIITVIGVIVNALTIHIFTHRQVPSSINILLTGLAMADALLLITAGPLYASVALYSYVTSVDPPVTSSMITLLETSMSYMTVYLYPVTSIFQTLSVWIMVFITIDRYIAVSHPFLARITCTKHRAINALIIISIASICYNAIRAFDYTLAEEIDTDDHGIPQVQLVVKHALRANQTYLIIYSHWMYFIFIFGIPFTILLFLNGLVIAVIRKAQKYREILSRQRKTDYATATMMIMLTVIFLICNSLAFTVNAIESFCGNSPKNQSDPIGNSSDHTDHSIDHSPTHTPLFYFLIDLSNLLIMAHCTSNFFIYITFSKQFRLQCRGLIFGEAAKRKISEALLLNPLVYGDNSMSTKKQKLLKLTQETYI